MGSTGKLRHGAGGVRSGSGGAAAFCGVRSLRCGALRVRCGAEPLCGETEARGCAAPPGMGGVRAPAAPRGGGSPRRGSASEALRFAWFGAVVFSPVWSALWGSRCRPGRIQAQPRTALPAGRPSDGPGMLLSGSLRSRNARGSVCHPPSPHGAVILSIPSLIPAAAPRWDAHPLSVRCSAFLSGAHKLQRFVRIAPWLSCRHCAARGGGRHRIGVRYCRAAGTCCSAPRGVWSYRGCRAAPLHHIVASSKLRFGGAPRDTLGHACDACAPPAPLGGLFQQHPGRTAAIKYLASEHSLKRGSHTPKARSVGLRGGPRTVALGWARRGGGG